MVAGTLRIARRIANLGKRERGPIASHPIPVLLYLSSFFFRSLLPVRLRKARPDTGMCTASQQTSTAQFRAVHCPYAVTVCACACQHPYSIRRAYGGTRIVYPHPHFARRTFHSTRSPTPQHQERFSDWAQKRKVVGLDQSKPILSRHHKPTCYEYSPRPSIVPRALSRLAQARRPAFRTSLCLASPGLRASWHGIVP